MTTSTPDRRFYLSFLFLALGTWGCAGPAGSSGDSGPSGPPGSPGPTPGLEHGTPDPFPLDPGEALPGLRITIESIEGSGKGRSFLPGDTVTLVFTVKDGTGERIPLDALSDCRVLVSGPTDHFQRVLPQADDVIQASTWNADGSYTYSFSSPLPADYDAPYNDTAAFGPIDGERTGQPLESGTYAVGMEAARLYLAGTEVLRDAGNAVSYFLLGDAPAIDRREMVTTENCGTCHDRLQAHEGMRSDVALCLTCHTAGAEDGNNPSVASGTPGTSIEFGLMVHRIHGAAHLPSVLGVTTLADGTRDYSAIPVPYELIGADDEPIDFSDVTSPQMPGAYVSFTMNPTNTTYTGTGGNGPMPRDVGYSALPGPSKRLEDEMRSGLLSCTTCHGDPDGDGPLPAPEDGALHTTALSRKACGSCHDDIVWSLPYTANGMTMPPQNNDAVCTNCHSASGSLLSVEDSHRHPYDTPAFNTGVNIPITGVAGGSGPGGRHQAGDPITATFSVKDDAGNDLHINTLTRFQMMVSGPSSNPQLILPNVNLFDFAFRKSTPLTGNGTIAISSFTGGTRQVVGVVFTSATTFDVVGSVDAPLAAQAPGTAVTYGGVTFTVTSGSTPFAAGDRFYLEVVPVAASYSVEIPIDILTENLGRATGGADVLSVGNAPLYWGRQAVFERTAIQAGAPLTASATALAPYLEVDSSLVPGIVSGDRIVVDDGMGNEEYLQVNMVQTVDDKTLADLGANDRLWVSPVLRYGHTAGTAVQEVTLTGRREGLAYTVSDASLGEITLVPASFTAGNPVVVSYRTHGRFGFRRAPGDTIQALFPPAGADSDDVGVASGDWKGLALLDGTYKVGAWANRDFSIVPLRVLSPSVKAWNDISTDLTTYRMISPPATRDFLYGDATEIELRDLVDPASCNRCHGDLQAHGFGRRGYETCENCHSIAGFEDGQKARFSTWYTGFTPGTSTEFRSLLHKAHRGNDLSQGAAYEVIGVFLGVPYPVTYEEVGFPQRPGGVEACTACHVPDSDGWKLPASRIHPDAESQPTHVWTIACGSCHDSPISQLHIESQTGISGEESCVVCHGLDDPFSVEKVHFVP